MVNKRRSLKRNRSIECVLRPISLDSAIANGSHECDVSDACENCDPKSGESTQTSNEAKAAIACLLSSSMDNMMVQLKSRKNEERSNKGKKNRSAPRKRSVSINNDEANAVVSGCVLQPVKKRISQKRSKKPIQDEVVTGSTGKMELEADSVETAQNSNSTPENVATLPVDLKDSDVEMQITNETKEVGFETIGAKHTSNGRKSSSYSRLSLKGRKEESVVPVAPIFKLSSCVPLFVDKTKTDGTRKVDVPSSSESSLVAAAPALVNLGNTCYFNSVIQVLYYTPTFIESVAVLVAEISATIRDNDTLATLENCSVTQLTGFICWKFVERLHELFQLMKKVDKRFSVGCVETEAISPGAVLAQLETMNALFTGGLQQDAHELLRCILSYIQDSIKLLNTHRSAISAAIEADKVDKLITDYRVSDGGVKGDKKCGVSGKASKNSKYRRSNGSESETAVAEAHESTNVSRITNFFARAGPKPKSVCEVEVKTGLLLDFIENTCEGLVERRTRCLECEQITKCSESFQDVEVVVQKSGSVTSWTKAEDEENSEVSWIVNSLEEIERLQGDNKYWCGVCEHHVEAERSVIFHRVPEILTIQMKRFSAFSSGFFGGFTKTMDCVNIPFKMQCLEKNCRESAQTSHRYELFSVLSHTGVSLSSGHYISYVLANGDAKLIQNGVESVDEDISRQGKSVLQADSKLGPWWYVCDDDSITAISQSDLRLKLSAGGATTPYLLFYRREKIR